jgi:NAD(P)-dependent dehydrogenase (short-subunit alcohol dehydrogenase family)
MSDNANSMAGKVAWITGSGRGMGQAHAILLAERGADIVVHDVLVDEARGTAARIEALGRRVFLSHADVASPQAMHGLAAEASRALGKIDVLVNNAGIGSIGAAEESSIAQAQAVFDINVFGVMRMVKEVLPHMRARGRGRIVNLSSVQGFIPAPYMAVYGASKHAIEGYSQSLDHEVRQYGIRALLVEPAYTRTGFEANSTQPDMPLQVYAQQRQTFGGVMAAAIKDGDDPAIVAKVIVAAATDPKPKLRYTAGTLAGRASTLRRFVPAWAFDRQIRKLNQLAA